MDFSEELTYPADIVRVNAMLADPSFQAARFTIPVFADSDVTVTQTDGTLTSVFTSLLDPGALPSTMARFVKGDTRVTITESWRPTEGDRRDGTFSITISGVPATLEATSSLRGLQDVTRRSLVGVVNVQIPLVGRKVEAMAVEIVPRLLANETKTSERYLLGEVAQ